MVIPRVSCRIHFPSTTCVGIDLETGCPETLLKHLQEAVLEKMVPLPRIADGQFRNQVVRLCVEELQRLVDIQQLRHHDGKFYFEPSQE